MLRRMLPLLVLSLLFWGPICADISANPDQGTGLSYLNARLGGFANADEKPAFDDCNLLAQFDNDEELCDPVFRSDEACMLLSDDESGFDHLRIVWGRLCVDTTVTEATDWSGSLFENKGAEITLRVIRFESNQDYIHPLTDRKLTEWTSRTSIHNDGIAVDIVIPRPRQVPDSATDTELIDGGDTAVTILVDTKYPELVPVEVVFETGPYSSTFALAEISALDDSNLDTEENF